MHDGIPYGRKQGQGQGHSREVDRQSPTGLIYCYMWHFRFSYLWACLIRIRILNRNVHITVKTALCFVLAARVFRISVPEHFVVNEIEWCLPERER